MIHRTRNTDDFSVGCSRSLAVMSAHGRGQIWGARSSRPRRSNQYRSNRFGTPVLSAASLLLFSMIAEHIVLGDQGAIGPDRTKPIAQASGLK